VLTDDNYVADWDLRSLKSSRIVLPNDSRYTTARALAVSTSGSGANTNLPWLKTTRLLLLSADTVRVYQVVDRYSGPLPFFEKLKRSARLTYLLPHGATVAALAIAPKSEYVTTSSGPTVRRWSISTGHELWRLELKRPVTAIAVSADDRYVAAGTSDGASVWLTDAGTVIAHKNRLLGPVAFMPDGQIAGEQFGGGVIRWNWQQDVSTDVGSSTRSAVAFSALFYLGTEVERFLISANGTRTVKFVTDAPPSAKIAQAANVKHAALSAPSVRTQTMWVAGPGPESYSMPLGATPKLAAISADGNTIALYVEKEIVIRNGRDGSVQSSFNYEKTPSNLAVSPDGRSVATIVPNAIEILGANDGKVIATINGAFSSCVFSPDGRYLAAAGALVRVIATSSWKDIASISQAVVRAMAFSPDSKYLATSTSLASGVTRVWSTADGTPQATMAIPWTGHLLAATSISFSPDGKYLATSGADGTRVWLWRESDVVEEACARVDVKGLGKDEWPKYIGEEEFKPTTCPVK
jgi:WD40 repeat protein